MAQSRPEAWLIGAFTRLKNAVIPKNRHY